jgi:hypothetical protein
VAEESVRSYIEVGPYINDGIKSDFTHALSPEVASTHLRSLSSAGMTHCLSNPDNSPCVLVPNLTDSRYNLYT